MSKPWVSAKSSAATAKSTIQPARVAPSRHSAYSANATGTASATGALSVSQVGYATDPTASNASSGLAARAREAEPDRERRNEERRQGGRAEQERIETREVRERGADEGGRAFDVVRVGAFDGEVAERHERVARPVELHRVVDEVPVGIRVVLGGRRVYEPRKREAETDGRRKRPREQARTFREPPRPDTDEADDRRGDERQRDDRQPRREQDEHRGRGHHEQADGIPERR